jgi:hypothetical protein
MVTKFTKLNGSNSTNVDESYQTQTHLGEDTAFQIETETQIKEEGY